MKLQVPRNLTLWDNNYDEQGRWIRGGLQSIVDQHIRLDKMRLGIVHDLDTLTSGEVRVYPILNLNIVPLAAEEIHPTI